MVNQAARLGYILSVDLSSGRSAREPFPETVKRRFLAGRGFAVHRLRESVAPGTDPLGAENVLIFSCGLLAATPAPGSSRLHLCALSPLTGILGSSNVGGPFADRLRSCGIQALVVAGCAPSPSILVVGRQGAAIMEAGPLWGTDTWQAETMLRQRFPEGRVAVLTIGPAGENRVPMACIVSDRDHAAGRTGLGAVMGAKNVKAVVVCGVQKRRPERTEVQKKAVAAYVRRIRQSREYAFFSRYGGAGYTVWCSDERFAPGYHYRSPRFAAADRIDGRRLEADRLRSRGCPRCPVRCKAELRRAGRPAGFRPEFESMVNLGAKCGLSDLDALVRLDNLCTRLGLDIISAATAIAFAMELSEKRLLPLSMSGGAIFGWGDAAAMDRLIRQMAAARGVGRMLGAGVRSAAEQIGPEARQLACHVKGLELSAYHPGYLLGTALGYAVSSRGGDFNNIYAAMEYSCSAAQGERMFGTPLSVDRRSIQGKGALIRHASMLTCALDALGLCKVPALSLIGDCDLESEADLARALTGMALDAADLLEAGERIVNIERLFNLEHGLDPERDDRLPERFYTAADADEGPFLTPDGFSAMLQDYYAAMGWNRRGHPRIETLCRLQIALPAQEAQDLLPAAAAGAGGETGAAMVPKTGQGRASYPRPPLSGSAAAETGVNKNPTRR